ncbi:alpha-glucosidase [Nitrospira lenta]|uniref:Putative alpha-glucosidase n=1 Tax=Nitrospira lenta TaxID=1436998 RepID=A0A330L695_9BACT|nr:alpha-glucosidase [Nitrospira lenta]SPP65238.1 putative alpha-glucosidase [Nitrospira lenta]
MTTRLPWWQSAVVYQIYPWSFQDSNGDGIGDIPGIISRLDYLNDGTADSLGIDAIWLSPIYPSPMVDFGYDVADFCTVDSRFGTLSDFDRLVKECHRRGIRLIMDLVLNHTSDQHPWFQDSRSSRSSAKRDWYYWADGKGFGRRPNNWNARFGGSSWTWDAHSGQYYLHSFLKEQPDLNWHNPAVRTAMWDVVKFWLDRGVDGFRLDAINWLGKDKRWPNNPFKLGLRGYTRQEHRYDRDQPLGHQALKELRALLSGTPDVVLIGEASADTPGGPSAFYGNGYDELHMLFDFRLLKSPWQAERFAPLLEAGDRVIPRGGWPTVVFSNHDQPRHIDRYGANGDAERRARAAAVLLFTLRGTPFIYYGEELGMRNTPLRYRDLRDPYTKRYWPFRIGRDPARTPMQWDGSEQAGFSTGRPWLPVSPHYRELNAAREGADPASLLNLYRRLIRLRKTFPALSEGTYRPIGTVPAGCLVFIREDASPAKRDSDMLVAVNFSSESRTVTVPDVTSPGVIRLSTWSGTDSATPWIAARFHLEPDEAIIVSLGNQTAA